MLASLGWYLLLVTLTSVRSENECDGTYKGGLYLMAINLPAQILGEFDDIADENQCFQECCKLVESGCNAVSFLNVDESPFCLLANCTPYNKCTWAKSDIGSVFRILKAEVNIPFENQTDWTVTNATSNATAGNRTLPENALPEINITEDQGAWNIFTDKPTHVPVKTTPDPFWESLEKEEDREESEQEANDNYNFGLTQSPDTSHDEAPDQASEIGGGTAALYQYMNTPAIAIAVCIGVVLLLLLLLVAGKRLVIARRKAQYNKLQDEESDRLTRNSPDNYYDDA